MNLLLSIIFSVCATLAFLFSFWTKLKEDYTRNQTFTTALYTLAGIALGATLAKYLAPIWWFYLSLFGGLLGIFVGIFRYKLRVFETLEAGILGGLTLIFFVFLYDFVIHKTIESAIASAVLILGIFSYLTLNKHYKNFFWYASGKVGFSGLVVAGGFFLIRSLVALEFPSVLSFVGNYESYISGILAFLSFLLLFNLSRKKP